MAVSIEKVAYQGWNNCIRLSNGVVEALILTDVGPRVLRFGFIGKENMLCEVSESYGQTGGDKFNMYGGHRLWHSPEHRQRTYEPDNETVEYIEIEGGVRVSPKTEKWTQIRKEMDISMHPTDASLRILHRLTNEGPWEVELSAWPITVMAPGGLEIMPQTQRDTGLLNNRTLSLWPYTKMNDPRLYWGNKYIGLKQEPTMKPPAKIGLSNEYGWAAYFNYGSLFVKQFAPKVGMPYPDNGCTYETYTTDFMLEMESLSPLSKLKQGEHVDHLERWNLYADVAAPSLDEDEIDAALKGKV